MLKRPLFRSAVAAAVLLSPSLCALAQSDAVKKAAEQEIARRQNRVHQAEDSLKIGDRAMAEKDFEAAFSNYRSACDSIVVSPLTEATRKKAVEKFAISGVKLAEQRISEGFLADASTILKTVLDQPYAPDCKPASALLANLQTPGYYNPTIGPKFAANVEQVKKLMAEAQGFYDTGRYDLAFKRYEQVLNIDPYNTAARKGQENVNLARDNYANSAYNETRSRALWKVDKAWENPVRKYGVSAGPTLQTQTTDAGNLARITNKLNSIMVPKIDFNDFTLQAAVKFLMQESRKLDTAEPDPNKRGVNIMVVSENGGIGGGVAPKAPEAAANLAIPGLEPAAQPAAPVPGAEVAVGGGGEKRVTLQLYNLPLLDALKHVAESVSMKIRITPNVVSIVPLSTPTDVLIDKRWKVPPTFLTVAPGGAPGGGGNGLEAGGAAGDATKGGSSIIGRAKAKDVLESYNIPFPPGSSAAYLFGSSELVVRNTSENIALIENLVDSLNSSTPIMISIETKFVEINQQNLNELSFDWLLGQSNLPGSDRVFTGGGTPGNGTAVEQADYPFPINGNNPLTSGNRNGFNALNQNAIDSLLYGTTGAAKVAPGMFSLAGVFTDPQFQLVIRALKQKKGVDLLSSPSVTARSGTKATIKLIREFRYPTEFDPPQIPQSVGSSSGGGLTGGGGGTTISPVTPTTPTSFDTRDTGVTMEVNPALAPDGQSIEMELAPQVVEFEGFINYGSPIKTVNPNAISSTLGSLLGNNNNNNGSVVLTDNVINQPIFSVRSVSTNITVWDGSTVVLGGLIREDVQKVEDKVPFLGDIPLLGRAFRSSVDQHMKKNLNIFVTARLINPAGEPIRDQEEKEEVVEPLGLPEAAAPALPEAPLFPK